MRVPSSRHNPQINAIIERTHLELLNILRTFELFNVIWEDEDRIWDSYLAKASWAIRSTYDTTLKHTSGELDFNRDYVMFECLWTHV